MRHDGGEEISAYTDREVLHLRVPWLITYVDLIILANGLCLFQLGSDAAKEEEATN